MNRGLTSKTVNYIPRQLGPISYIHNLFYPQLFIPYQFYSINNPRNEYFEMFSTEQINQKETKINFQKVKVEQTDSKLKYTSQYLSKPTEQQSYRQPSLISKNFTQKIQQMIDQLKDYTQSSGEQSSQIKQQSNNISQKYCKHQQSTPKWSNKQQTLNHFNFMHTSRLSRRHKSSFSKYQQKNDSKNVGKGMIKAYAHIILSKLPQNRQFLKKYAKQHNLNLQKYLHFMDNIRKSYNISIFQIRQMLMTHQFAQHTRRLGYNFIRKKFIRHIFNSKVQKRHIYLKYLNRWKQIFQNPQQFTFLK